MALDKLSLKAGIKAAFVSALGVSPTTEQNAKFDSLAEQISDAIDTFVKTGSVRVDPGIPVATSGNATNQTGATTGVGNGVIS